MKELQNELKKTVKIEKNERKRIADRKGMYYR
jgi:hypothetical protein